MAITFVTKYPAALKNAAWQSKKSFKDKAKAKTKTGLGEALTTAEKDWGKIKFDNLIAAKQNLEGKSLNEKKAAQEAAKEYLEGPVVQKAITSLNAAASKAKTTGKNTFLSTTATQAATALSGALLKQALLLHEIKLDDFQTPIQNLNREVNQLERRHTEILRSVDNLRDDLKDAPTKNAWQTAKLGDVLDDAMQVSQTISDETGDEHWKDINNSWRRLLVAYAAANQRVNSASDQRAAEEINEFTDLVQNTLGGIWT